MRILHLPYCFYPDAVGGTEIYAAALARELLALSYESVIVAPGRVRETYIHGQVKVIRLQTSEKLSLMELYGAGDAQVAEQFGKILTDEKPDIVHMHAFTSGVSIRLARMVKARGLPLVLTYHTPTVTCPRGTMMRWGSVPCDGLMDLSACVSCTLHGKGVSRLTAEVLSGASAVLGAGVRAAHLEGGLWTFLRMRQLLQLRFAATHELFNLCDHIVATARWVKEALLRNKVSAKKITVLKQGLCNHDTNLRAAKNISLNHETPPINHETSLQSVKLAFLGRFDPTKGLHVLIKALAQEPHLNLNLDIYGINQEETRNNYTEQIFKMAQNDTRIQFLPTLPQSEVVVTLKDYDALLVPSQWMETGPMVVLEAFAAGIPVIGSDLGGIRDFVRDDVDGILVSFNEIGRWRKVFRRISSDDTVLPYLKANVQPPETMQAVSGRMNDIYKQVLVHSN